MCSSKVMFGFMSQMLVQPKDVFQDNKYRRNCDLPFKMNIYFGFVGKKKTDTNK